MHDQQASVAPSYLSRRPERLVLEGYRGWTWAVSGTSPSPWQGVRELYRAAMGDDAPRALESLDLFASTLGICAGCPLRMLRRGCRNVCRDEALVLALVSAIQHSDDAAIDLCLASLCRAEKVRDVALTAGIYAIMMRGAGFTLLPVPAAVVTSIETKWKETQASVPAGSTIH